MVFIHEKEANSNLPKSGLKHIVAVTPSISYRSNFKFIISDQILLPIYVRFNG